MGGEIRIDMDYLTDTQKEIVGKLRARYSNVHPVLFQRVLEKAKNEVELFDILDTIPDTLPLIFNSDIRRLTPVGDMLKK